jgi:hypothetical protein
MLEILVTRCLRRNKGRNWQRKLKKRGRMALEGVIQKSGGGRRVGGCFILTEWGLGSERGG